MPKRRRTQKHEKEVVEDNERYFLNPESVSVHLFCSICQEVFREPQRAPCGHSYCKNCIYQWLKQSKTCPEDRRPIQKHDLHYDFILANIIGDQMVACPFRKNGCDHVGKLELLYGHEKSCIFNPANVPEFIKNSDKWKVNLHSSKHTGGDVICLNDTCDSPCTSGGITQSSDVDSDTGLPTPSKPSLMMRLFKNGGNQRELLCSMFDEKENERPNTRRAHSSSS
ncbi:TNF receptor-associated factor 6-like [Amphiura filiformis]|uniref:TNF receptor-associated factor 6-like n=1 Tax=Amphiura filiformis TaxID=82378 RepID=UPI003B21837B